MRARVCMSVLLFSTKKRNWIDIVILRQVSRKTWFIHQLAPETVPILVFCAVAFSYLWKLIADIAPTTGPLTKQKYCSIQWHFSNNAVLRGGGIFCYFISARPKLLFSSTNMLVTFKQIIFHEMLAYENIFK